MLEVFRVITPQLGIYDPMFVRASHHGNPFLFATHAATHIKTQIKAKEAILRQAISEVEKGTLSASVKTALDKEWTPIRLWFEQQIATP
jgi:hypothetical protein